MENKIFDTTHKFVRVIEAREGGLIEFEFAIGEPELFVELIMPAHAFVEFCEANQVTVLEQVRALALVGENFCACHEISRFV
jgi:phenol hydroxylase P0 protein